MRILLLIWFVSGSLLGFTQSYEQYVKAGAEKERVQNYAEAIKVYTSALAKYPDSLELYLSRSRCHQILGKIDEAFEDINTALLQPVTFFRGYIFKGQLYMANNEPDMAIAVFSAVIKYAEEDSIRFIAYWSRGGAKVFKRDFTRAKEDFDLAYKLDSGNLGFLNDYANVLNETGDRAAALFVLNKVLSIDSNYVAALNNLGFAYIAEAGFEKAITIFDKVLAINDNQPYAYNNRGYAKMKTGDLKGAMRDINQSIDLLAGNPYAYRNKALVYLAMDKKKEACDEIKKALEKGFTLQYGRELEELKFKHCK